MTTEKSRMTMDEKELYILNKSVKNAALKQGRLKITNSNVKSIIEIIENYIRKNKLVCYGGIAINNILPENKRFYDFQSEVPDYDFFSPTALRDVKKIADIFYDAGYKNVEAKAGIHKGTYKLYVDFFQVADVTEMDKKIFEKVKSEAISKKGIMYAPANLLRMMSYTELSRPGGNVSRWEKVMTRLSLLNKYFPIKTSRCDVVEFQRDFEGEDDTKTDIYHNVRDALIEEEVVFFGGWACSLYGRYMPKHARSKLEVELPDFDVLSVDPYTTALAVKRRLLNGGFKGVRIKKQAMIKEMLPYHYEIIVEGNTVCFIYDNQQHCYSYNVIRRNNRLVKIATIDTMLKFYLAFVYCDKKYFDVDRLLCMSQYLLKVQYENKLAQTGLLKRFTIDCYGDEQTIEDMRGEKHVMFEKLKKLKNTRNSLEYDKMFLKYTPGKKQRSKKTRRFGSKTQRKNKKRTSTRKFSNWLGV